VHGRPRAHRPRRGRRDRRRVSAWERASTPLPSSASAATTAVVVPVQASTDAPPVLMATLPGPRPCSSSCGSRRASASALSAQEAPVSAPDGASSVRVTSTCTHSPESGDGHLRARAADPLRRGDRDGAVLAAGELPGRAARRALQPQLGAESRPGQQHQHHHHHHDRQHDRRLRRGGPPVVPQTGRPGGPRPSRPHGQRRGDDPHQQRPHLPDASRATRNRGEAAGGNLYRSRAYLVHVRWGACADRLRGGES
jgi:hypothetical protein